MTDDADDNLSRNAESRARTHLANERTFLAWFRTAVALIALGLAAGQFLSRQVLPEAPLRRALAIAFVAGGVFALLAGLRRYYRTARQIEAGEFRPAGPSVIVLTALLVIVAGLAIAFILLLGP